MVTEKNEDINDDIEDKPMMYGLFGCTPRWLQWCLSPKMALLWLSYFAVVHGFAVNGITNVNVSSIGRRYELPSSRVGLVASAADISASIFVLPLAYFGAHAHQPRMLAIGALFMSVGSFIMTIPQWAAGLYHYSERTVEQCDIYGNATQCSAVTSHSQNYLYVLMLGQALHGLGSCMLYSLGVVFIDSHCTTRNNPIYQGIFHSMAVVGPAIGYLVGGRMLAIYVDFYRVDMDSLDVTPLDPRWVGAWWVGFSISSILAFTVFLGLLPYPHHLPDYIKINANRKSEAHADGGEELTKREGFGTSIKDFPLSMKIIFCNPTLILINLAIASEGLIISGISTFLPQFIQQMFSVTAGQGAIYGGLLSLTGASTGLIAGGIAVRLLRLKIKGMLRMNVILCLICVTLQGPLILFYCQGPSIPGVNVHYINITTTREEPSNLISECNNKCVCTPGSYEPVCGVDGAQYFSPCHAGCENIFFKDGKMVLGNCTCIQQSSNNVSIYEPMGQAGLCPSGCTTLNGYLGIFFIVTFSTFMMFVPATQVALRCVPDKSRAVGMAVRNLFGRILGGIPGPVLYGAIFEQTCLVWQERCSVQGACWIYDRWKMIVYLSVTGIILRTITGIMFFIASLCYKPPPEETHTVKVKLDKISQCVDA